MSIIKTEETIRRFQNLLSEKKMYVTIKAYVDTFWNEFKICNLRPIWKKYIVIVKLKWEDTSADRGSTDNKFYCVVVAQF
jgi:hypothetical protein